MIFYLCGSATVCSTLQIGSLNVFRIPDCVQIVLCIIKNVFPLTISSENGTLCLKFMSYYFFRLVIRTFYVK